MVRPQKRYFFFKGRVALHAILKAAGIGPGDQVLLPGYTCVVVPNAILYLGAVPVYLDIDPRTYNLDPILVKSWLDSAENKQSRAIIVQHTYGIPCDMDEVLPAARENELLVIEDSCHALGSTYKGRQVGTLGDAAFFSSQWSKPITTGLGGWATLNDPALAAQMEAALAQYPGPRFAESFFLMLQYLAYCLAFQPRLFWVIQGLYRQLGSHGLAIGSSTATELSCKEPPNFMKSMGRFQRPLLEKLLANIEKHVVRRNEQKSMLDALLPQNGLPPLDLDPGFDPVVLRYPVRVKNKEEVLQLARRQRVQLGDWFLSPVHPNLDHWKTAGYEPGSCPIAETISATTINIPLGPRVSTKEIIRTVAFLREVGIPT
jgi:dTDP-4-amino-4,6-dideoxygalactose transaminase